MAILGLISSVDPPLTSVRVVSIPQPVPRSVAKSLLPSRAFPLFAVAILCVWAIHTSPAPPKAAASTHELSV